jgi:regulator of cell morphogenesis and NO signaling
MKLNPEMKLKDVVLEYPLAAEVLERAGLDYCCGGNQTVGQACSHVGVASKDLLDQLKDAAKQGGPEAENWKARSLSELTQHIVKKHHEYVREALPQIHQHLARVLDAHGKNHPEIAQIQGLFRQLGDDMMEHMQKEEYLLFPCIEQFEQALERGLAVPPPFFGTVRNPISMMLKEHDSAGDLVNAIRRLTHDYQPPEDACTTFVLSYKELLGFDRDLRQHVHLENNVLFPRAVELEAKHLAANA